MAAGHELIPELIIDMITPPMLTSLWLLVVGVNNRIVDKMGKGSKVEAHAWRLLIQTYLVVLLITLVHSCAR
ncbi:MAG: hypothetical protein WBA18_03490 [Terracidiphilus sp.]